MPGTHQVFLQAGQNTASLRLVCLGEAMALMGTELHEPLSLGMPYGSSCSLGKCIRWYHLPDHDDHIICGQHQLSDSHCCN